MRRTNLKLLLLAGVSVLPILANTRPSDTIWGRHRSTRL